MSARMMARRKPASIPAKCPTKSTLGEMVDIMMQLVTMKANHKKTLERLSPSRSHVKRTSAAQTPRSPKPLVEAPTASFMGSTATEIRFPRKPQKHVEEAELPPPELLLHPKADAHLEEEVEEDVQCICMQHHRQHQPPDGSLSNGRAPGGAQQVQGAKLRRPVGASEQEGADVLRDLQH